MQSQAKMFQKKEQDKTPEYDPSEEELYQLPDRELKLTLNSI